MDARVQRFVDALAHLEATREVGPIARLFAPEAVLGNVITPEPARGAKGAESFWSIYRHTFDTVRSTFHRIIACGDEAALEWETTGTGPRGEPVRYRGVSVLGFEGERLVSFQAYFDAGELGRQLSQGGAARKGPSVW